MKKLLVFLFSSNHAVSVVCARFANSKAYAEAVLLYPLRGDCYNFWGVSLAKLDRLGEAVSKFREGLHCIDSEWKCLQIRNAKRVMDIMRELHDHGCDKNMTTGGPLCAAP